MEIKMDLLSRILYGVIIVGIIVLTCGLIGLPRAVPVIFKNSVFYNQATHTRVLVLLYITGIPSWIILWMTKILSYNIIKRKPFCKSSIVSLKWISICASIIFVCYLAACFMIQVALGIIVITIGAFVVAIIAGILYRLVQVAIEIQTENELTI